MRFVRFLVMACWVGAFFGNSATASIVSVIKGNDSAAIFWLNNHYGQSISSGDLVVKQDLPNALTGPGQGGWNLSGSTRAETWTLATATYTPEFWFVKFGNLIAIYDYDGVGSSPFSDSFNLDIEVWNPTTKKLVIDLRDKNNLVLHAAGSYKSNGVYDGGLNAKAGVSHVSAYGSQQAVPEPGTMMIWGIGLLAGLVGSGRARRC